MEYFDTHAHYDDAQFDKDREEVLNKIHIIRTSSKCNFNPKISKK